MNPGMPVVCDPHEERDRRYAIIQLKELEVDQARYQAWLATVAHAQLRRKRQEEWQRAIARLKRP